MCSAANTQLLQKTCQGKVSEFGTQSLPPWRYFVAINAFRLIARLRHESKNMRVLLKAAVWGDQVARWASFGLGLGIERACDVMVA